MAENFGVKFSRERLALRCGGVFDFDAVGEDRSIVATISTSGAKTASGKLARSKMLKLHSDMLFLTMVEANFVQVLRQLRQETGFLLIGCVDAGASPFSHQAGACRGHQPLYARAAKANRPAHDCHARRKSPPALVPSDAGPAAIAAQRPLRLTLSSVAAALCAFQCVHRKEAD
jgi:hypothetical protein